MKKILTLFAIVGLLFAPLTFAATSKTAGYYSTQHPAVTAAVTGKAASKYPFTNITVVNSSYDIIYVIVPGSQVYDRLFPNANDHIYNHDPDVYWTPLLLLDPYQDITRPIFDGAVCRRAIVTVFGGPGHYNTFINSNAC